MENQLQIPSPVLPKTNLSKIILLSILEFIIVGGSVFVGFQIGKNQILPYAPPSPIVTPSPAVNGSEFSCIEDSDCTLVVANSWADCSLYNQCEAVDYSQNKWIAVNQSWYSSKFHCDSTAMMCNPEPINDSFKAICNKNGVCQKTNLPD